MMSIISERPVSKGREKDYASAKQNRANPAYETHYSADPSPIQQVDEFLAELDYRNTAHAANAQKSSKSLRANRNIRSAKIQGIATTMSKQQLEMQHLQRKERSGSKSHSRSPHSRGKYQRNSEHAVASYGPDTKKSQKTRHSSIGKGVVSDKDFQDLDVINELKLENIKIKTDYNIMKAEKV